MCCWANLFKIHTKNPQSSGNYTTCVHSPKLTFGDPFNFYHSQSRLLFPYWYWNNFEIMLEFYTWFVFSGWSTGKCHHSHWENEYATRMSPIQLELGKSCSGGGHVLLPLCNWAWGYNSRIVEAVTDTLLQMPHRGTPPHHLHFISSCSFSLLYLRSTNAPRSVVQRLSGARVGAPLPLASFYGPQHSEIANWATPTHPLRLPAGRVGGYATSPSYSFC